MKHFILFFFSCLTFWSLAQKKSIDHSDYDRWKTLSNTVLSEDGNYVTYEIKPHRGDGFLYIYSKAKDRLDSIPRGTNAVFSGNSELLFFKITPGFDTLRTCELNKIDKKKWPKDSLGILVLASDSLIKKPDLDQFKVGNYGQIVAYLSHSNELPDALKAKKKNKKKDSDKPKITSEGHVLTILNPFSGTSSSYKDVKSFAVSEQGNFVAFTTHQKATTDSVTVNVFNTTAQVVSQIRPKHADIKELVTDKTESWLAFVASDDTSKVKNYHLSVFDLRQLTPKHALSAQANPDIDSAQAISPHLTPTFTDDGESLYFGVTDTLKRFFKDSLLESEKVKVDLWFHGDKRLQSQQLAEQKNDLKHADLYVLHLNSGEIVPLSNDTLRVTKVTQLHGEYLLGTSNENYKRSYQWDMSGKRDLYRVSVNDGKATLLKSAVSGAYDLAPSGKAFVYFDAKKGGYFLGGDNLEEEVCITCDQKEVVWTHDLNGMPSDPDPIGIVGWEEGENRLFLQSKHDLWIYDRENQKLYCPGEQQGERSKIEFRAEVWNKDSVYISMDNLYLKGFDLRTKGTHIYGLTGESGAEMLVKKAYFDAELSELKKAERSEAVLYRKMTFLDYPDLYLTDLQFTTSKRLSVTNPQQSEYLWGTVELISWKSYDGTPLEGLLYKPEDFDPNKNYPMLVYFYELYNDRFHQHYIPKPTASIILPSEYVSAGYVVLIPDIRYKTGFPAKSAYDCIMSATDAALRLYPNIDSTRLGLQGQSWGGYQTAQLITMTNRYRAAMAGAPVANMFSAYGGIRWGTGINRQFQYERTQSRIGATIWENPERYVENSPLFHLPKVQTPLLIMHNDMDDAVPWYQGIELFTGLTRLNKEVWMLNYNEDKHNLMKDANRRDLSIRMRQFFDHYLMGTPAPRWMTEGIPARVKGEELRYELKSE